MTDQQASSSRSDDYARMERFRQAVSQMAESCDAAAKTWKTQIDEYSALKNRLSTLDHKLSHDIMVPFGSVAFMTGKQVKTNQVTVLLGDNWFVERSCHQAIMIIDRRIKYAQQALEEVESQKKLTLSRLDFSNAIASPSASNVDSNTVEIMEPYDEKRESEAKQKRMSRTASAAVAQGQTAKVMEAPKGVSQDDFEALMKHLDTLELEDDDSEGEDADESLDSDDIPSSEDEKVTEVKSKAAEVESKLAEKRRHSVTFTEELEIGPTPSIASIASLEPKTIVNEDTGFSALPKSILRNKNVKSPVDTLALQETIQQSAPPTILPMSADVFTGIISERSLDTMGEDTTEAQPKRVSKFKQRKNVK
uniref:Unconventional prefoldin RPB5 interactor n=1 Tax=Plectus sambesii TaxID=2011161 RepID=A0A914WRE4_9BILA